VGRGGVRRGFAYCHGGGCAGCGGGVGNF
jgi:hypothetical protein